MATLGVRVDHHEIFGNETSPRAYLVWQATPELTIKGGYGEAFKAPTLKQISSNYVGAEGPHTFYGNYNIRPETSRSFELAADYRIGPLTLRSTLFQNKVKDLIYLRLLRQQGIRNFYQYDNVNRARIRGAELGLGWDITPNLHWNNDVTLLHARDGNGAELANRPRSVVHSRLHWEAPRDFDLRLGAHYTGRQRVSANTRLSAGASAWTTWATSVWPRNRRTSAMPFGVEPGSRSCRSNSEAVPAITQAARLSTPRPCPGTGPLSDRLNMRQAVWRPFLFLATLLSYG